MSFSKFLPWNVCTDDGDCVCVVLATQNMDASGIIARHQEIEFKALEGSLSMMSKVLNDVLDL